VLTVRQSKFGKSRLVPLHPDHNRSAAQLPAAAGPAAPAARHHCGVRLPGRHPVLYSNVQATFARLTRQAGLQPRSTYL